MISYTVLTRKFQLIWEVILPTPAKVWLVDMQGVQIRHVKTGKLLSVTDKTYPDGSWGDGMKEVAGAKPMVGNNKWKVGFIRIPNYGEKNKFPQSFADDFLDFS